MTPEQQLERVRMCLAEAGYDPEDCGWVDGANCPWFSNYIPDYVCWKVEALVGTMTQCWPCNRQKPNTFPQDPDWTRPHQPCGHPVDPFCAEDAEMAS